jgi:hypothetical protein
MVFKIFSGLLTPGADEKREVTERAVTVNGLDEYRETEILIGNLKAEMKNAPTDFQKRQMEDEIHRHQCRQDALRSAAVILIGQLEDRDNSDIVKAYAITEQDIARVGSGITNPNVSEPHEIARFLIEEAESDFISGRAS